MIPRYGVCHRPVSPKATMTQLPLLWWGVRPTLSGILQLDESPEPHSAQGEALDARESRSAMPKGYLDSIRSASFPTDVRATR
jgi:hypothetical protein